MALTVNSAGFDQYFGNLLDSVTEHYCYQVVFKEVNVPMNRAHLTHNDNLVCTKQKFLKKMCL